MSPENNQQPNQAPVTPDPKHAQQPVNQAEMASGYFAQPQAAPVQYVVQAQSLKGKGGWLGFFMVVAALYALAEIGIFFSSFTTGRVIDTVFAPILCLAALAAVILIALEMKIAKWVYIGFYVAACIYNDVSAIIAGSSTSQIATVITVNLVVTIFVALYFVTSKRVKETLVK